MGVWVGVVGCERREITPDMYGTIGEGDIVFWPIGIVGVGTPMGRP